MPRNKLLEAVRLLAVNAMEAEARERQAVVKNGPSTVVFVDLQNTYHFLKEAARVQANSFRLVDFIHSWLHTHGMKADEVRIYTGVHRKEREPERHARMLEQLEKVEASGARVFTLPLHYQLDRTTGLVRAIEKGIDVRIASELIQSVAEEGVEHAILFTQDNDLSQAVAVATAIAEARGKAFSAYTPVLTGATWDNNGKCGQRGILLTTHLEIAVSHIREFERPASLRSTRPHVQAPAVTPTVTVKKRRKVQLQESVAT